MLLEITLALAFFGAGFIGWRRAARRGGSTADRLQFAAAHAIPAVLLTLLIHILILRIGFGLPADLLAD